MEAAKLSLPMLLCIPEFRIDLQDDGLFIQRALLSSGFHWYSGKEATIYKDIRYIFCRDRRLTHSTQPTWFESSSLPLVELRGLVNGT